jgi:hypothetical protein
MFPGLKPAIIAIALIGFVSPSAPGIVGVYRNSIAQERRVERGSRIVVRNEFGDIGIVGSDRDTIEAFATNLNGSPPASVSISEASSDNKKVLTVRAVESGSDPKPQIKLVVKVPRYAELEPIYLRMGNITVSDLDGGASLRTDDGNISVHRVGSPGGGLVDVKMGSGSVDLSNINGDVRIVGISSNITVKCIKGDVAGRVMSGTIAVSNIEGDVDLNGSSGTLSFTGPIRSAGHYRLNILSGEASMSIPDKVGFTAVLSAYNGHLETDFQFSNASPTSPGRNKRVIGKYGDGTGRIELDSFSGNVHLRKIEEGSGTDCKR